MAYGGEADFAADTGATSIPIGAFDVTPAAGSLGFACFSYSGSGTTVTSVVDSTTAAWTVIDSQYDATNDAWLLRAYRENISGSITSVTANLSASALFRRGCAVWHSGVLTSGAYDKGARQNAARTTATDNATSTATATLAQADELIIGSVMNDDAAATITAGTGYTKRVENAVASQAAVEDLTVAATTGLAATWTFSTTGRYLASVDAFKLASGGVGGQPRIHTVRHRYTFT